MEKTDSFEQEIKSSQWFTRGKFTSIEKLKAHSHSLKSILEDNKRMEAFCTEKHFAHVMSKKDFFESKNAKTLARAGVPYKYLSEFITKMFNCQGEDAVNFEIKHRKIFNERDPRLLKDYVPYYTNGGTFKQSLPVHYLNPSGEQSVKEVQWMLNSVLPTIDHCPILIHLNSLLHCFCTKEEVFYILRNLINLNYNLKETSKIRWHMRFSYLDNEKVITSIVQCLRELGEKQEREIFEHFEKINFPAERLLEEVVFNFFMGFLRLEGIFRLLPFYLREGIKALYRISHAVFKTVDSSALLNISSADSVVSTFRKECQKISNWDKLFEAAYAFGLTRNNNKYDIQLPPDIERKDSYYGYYHIPKLKLRPGCATSRILSEARILDLYSKLPTSLRIKDLSMVFSTLSDSYSLKALYQSSEKMLDKDLKPNDFVSLLLIETSENEIFGGIVGQLVYPTNGKFEYSSQNILLREELRDGRPTDGELKIYQFKKGYNEVVYGDSECFLIGTGEQGSAIRLDKELKHGFSNPCASFDAPSLTTSGSGEYFVKNIEVYVFV